MITGENPCNICSHNNCDGCVFNIIYHEKNQCSAFDCMCNYDGSCLFDFYDDCGLQKVFDDEESSACMETEIDKMSDEEKENWFNKMTGYKGN